MCGGSARAHAGRKEGVWPAHTWKGVLKLYAIAQYAKALQKPTHRERRKMANQTPRRLIPALSCHASTHKSASK